MFTGPPRSAGKSQELIDALAKRAPLERLGTVEDIARVVVFLLSEESGWVHGQVLRVNGGMMSPLRP